MKFVLVGMKKPPPGFPPGNGLLPADRTQQKGSWKDIRHPGVSSGSSVKGLTVLRQIGFAHEP